MNRVKAGILDEFERTRSQYEEALDRARMASKDRLKEKRAGGRPGGMTETEDDLYDPSDIELKALFEGAIDSFLEDPVQRDPYPTPVTPERY